MIPAADNIARCHDLDQSPVARVDSELAPISNFSSTMSRNLVSRYFRTCHPPHLNLTFTSFFRSFAWQQQQQQ